MDTFRRLRNTIFGNPFEEDLKKLEFQNCSGHECINVEKQEMIKDFVNKNKAIENEGYKYQKILGYGFGGLQCLYTKTKTHVIKIFNDKVHSCEEYLNYHSLVNPFLTKFKKNGRNKCSRF